MLCTSLTSALNIKVSILEIYIVPIETMLSKFYSRKFCKSSALRCHSKISCPANCKQKARKR